MAYSPEVAMIRLALCMLFAVLTAACSSVQAYDGAEREDAQLAFLVPETQANRQRDAGPFGAPPDGGKISLLVNGKTLAFGKPRFAVLPGRVTIAATYEDERTPYPDKRLETRPITLTFNVAAGHVYAVRGRAEWSSGKAVVTIWVVDGATKRVVASAAVPESNVIMKNDPPDLG